MARTNSNTAAQPTNATQEINMSFTDQITELNKQIENEQTPHFVREALVAAKFNAVRARIAELHKEVKELRTMLPPRKTRKPKQ